MCLRYGDVLSIKKWIYKGTENLAGEDNQIRLALLNSLCMIGMGICAVFFVLWTMQGEYAQSGISVFVGSFFLISLLANYHGYANFGRFFTVVGSVAAIFISYQSTGANLQIDKFFIGIAATPLLYFPFDQKRNILIAILFTSLAAILTPMFPNALPFLPKADPEIASKLVPVVTPLSFLVSLMAPALLLLILERYFNRMRESKEVEITSHRMSSLLQLSSGIVHGVNNPLSIIEGRINRLEIWAEKKGLFDEEFERNLNSLEDAIARITSIIRSLRSFTKSNSYDVLDRTNLYELVSESLHLCQERVITRDIDLKLNLGGFSDLYCVKSDVMQVLIQLVNNSIASFEQLDENMEKEIVISSFENKNGFFIEIYDNAQGVDQEILDMIIDPFDPSMGVEKESGLGLKIAKGVLSQHGGFLNIQTEKNQWTKVTIGLPFQKEPKVA